MIKWRKNDDKNDDHDDVWQCFLFNPDHNHDHFQTLGKISVGIANGHSWSIITPYLVKYKKWFSIAFECKHVNVINKKLCSFVLVSLTPISSWLLKILSLLKFEIIFTWRNVYKNVGMRPMRLQQNFDVWLFLILVCDKKFFS